MVSIPPLDQAMERRRVERIKTLLAELSDRNTALTSKRRYGRDGDRDPVAAGE